MANGESEVLALKKRISELEDELRQSTGLGRSRSDFRQREISENTTIVLFGADGNLATKKTYPTLFSLWLKNILPKTTLIVGYARAGMSEDEFRRLVYKSIYSSAHAQKERKSFLQRCHYVSGQFDGDMLELQRMLEALEAPNTVRIYYLAVPPFLYPRICRALRTARRKPERFVLEKPFGRDSESCRKLCDELGELVTEEEAFRIDHYLGKELVMNVLVLRFANVCFQAIWSRFYIARVDVECLEEIGTGGRGGYFDSYGIIRDVMQNHLAQILALVAMEQPLSFTAEDIRREKVKVLRAVRPLALNDLIVGQYDGYHDDDTVVDKKSKTETFAAAKLFIDNPRWAGVPFILTAAKAVSQKKVELKITFHKVAGAVPECRKCDANELVVRVQPDECIYWRVQNRVPGLHSKVRIEPRRMNLLYTPNESRGMPEAYERLIMEVLRGDATNFVSVDELDAAWAIFTPALQALESANEPPERYAFGSTGPSIDKLLRGTALGLDSDDDDFENPPSPQSLASRR